MPKRVRWRGTNRNYLNTSSPVCPPFTLRSLSRSVSATAGAAMLRVRSSKHLRKTELTAEKPTAAQVDRSATKPPVGRVVAQTRAYLPAITAFEHSPSGAEVGPAVEVTTLLTDC